FFPQNESSQIRNGPRNESRSFCQSSTTSPGESLVRTNCAPLPFFVRCMMLVNSWRRISSMATTPQSPHKPPPPPPPLKTRADDHPPPAVSGGHLTKQDEAKLDDRESARPIIGVKGTPIEDGSRDPDTI